MKSICLYFQVHQPFRFRTYRFFDIGHDHYYYDDFLNRSIVQKIAKKCYLPANKILLELIKAQKGKFKVAFSITGSVLEQMELYSPETLKSFQDLAATGCVEFLAETYSHSLVSIKNEREFRKQVEMQVKKVESLFGQTPKVFRNTELVYSDKIGDMVSGMGFKAMLSEGAKHVLGWKSPNFVYCNTNNSKLKLLLRNYKLSDDIAFRFGNQAWNEWPLTAGKFTAWLEAIDKKEEVVNLFMDYETFGEHQWEGSGIFEFLKAFPAEVLSKKQFKFSTPSEVAQEFEPVSVLNVPHHVSWADEERDLTAWLGNNLQWEAFDNLYSLSDEIAQIEDKSIQNDWLRLQNSDHFYYMCTKFFADGAVHQYFNPFKSPYDAFINYMNVLADFSERVKAAPKTLKIKNEDFIKPLVDDKPYVSKTSAVESATSSKQTKKKIADAVEEKKSAGKKVVDGKKATTKTSESLTKEKKTAIKTKAAPVIDKVLKNPVKKEPEAKKTKPASKVEVQKTKKVAAKKK